MLCLIQYETFGVTFRDLNYYSRFSLRHLHLRWGEICIFLLPIYLVKVFVEDNKDVNLLKYMFIFSYNYILSASSACIKEHLQKIACLMF